MLAVTTYDVVLWAHIVAVLAAFGGIFTYPLWFALIRTEGLEQRAFFHRGQAFIGGRLIGPSLLVVIVAGAYLASDRDLWGEVWVIVPLVIALVFGFLGPVYFGRNEERLAELAAQGDQAGYDAAFRPFRVGVNAALVAVLVAAFFMVTKLGA